MSSNFNRLRRPQQGMTLIELMVSMIIGLGILAALSQVFVASQSNYSLQGRMGDLQENARFAMYFLQRDIRMAGYPLSNAALAAFDTTTTTDGTTDRITVQYVADTAGNNCLGNAYAAGATVITTYSIAADANNVSRLMCTATVTGTAAPAAQPVVDGIEGMQILYGVDTDTDVTAAGYGYANSYVPAGSVTAAQWTNRRVVAVRISLLVSTNEPITGDQASTNTAKYTLLNADPVGPLTKAYPAGSTTMKPVRAQVFTTTIELRNRTG